MNPTIRVKATSSAAGLVLRPWGGADAADAGVVAAVAEAYRDPAMRHWLTGRIDGDEDARRWLENQRLGWESGERLGFAVHEAAYGDAREAPYGGAGSLVANVSLRWDDDRPGSAEAGYWTVASARGRGVASRALVAVTAWAFDTFATRGPDRLDRVELVHQLDNLGSCRVAEKAGYTFDRILPAFPPFPLDGHAHVCERA